VERGTKDGIFLLTLAAVYALLYLILPFLWMMLLGASLVFLVTTKRDLFLDKEAKETSSFNLKKGDKIKVIVKGSKRFVVYLTTNIMKKRFDSVKRSRETKNFDEVWSIENDDKYSFVVEPVDVSPFWVTIKVYIAQMYKRRG